MRSSRILLALSATALLLLFVAVPAASGEESMKEQTVRLHLQQVGTNAPTHKGSRPDFGILDGTTVNVGSYRFQGFNPFNDVIHDDGNAFRFFNSSGSNIFVANVDLPSGVVVDFVEMSDCIAVAGDLFVAFWDATYGQGSVAGTMITSFSTAAGCGVDGSYGIGYQISANYNHPLVLYVDQSNTFGGGTKFNDVTVGYHRIVSPAPGSPTFNDVQPGDFGFQFIEALVASGITGGCQASPPLYCPNDPLTRAQMAVFLSKALGLHWPN